MPGDLVLSKPEQDPEGKCEWKAVEEVFTNFLPIWELHVGDQIIRTSAEHPFYVVGLGWLAAAMLQSGHLLLTHDGRTLPVKTIINTGEEKPVYNIRVADFHTYFVGCEEWGFSVWAHNMCAYRSLNEADIVAIKAGGGLSREGGAGGQAAISSLIGDSSAKTKYMSATEKWSVVVEMGDVNNYVQFDTDKCIYITNNELLTSSSYKQVREDLKANGKLDWLTTQAHGLIVKVLPRAAMTKIVIDGKEVPV